MDPNANLQEQDRFVVSVGRIDAADRRRLSEFRQALESWIARGGFEPDWTAYPLATKAFRTWQRNRRKFVDLYR